MSLKTYNEPCTSPGEASMYGGCLMMALSLKDTLAAYETVEEMRPDLEELIEEIKHKLSLSPAGKVVLDSIVKE